MSDSEQASFSIAVAFDQGGNAAQRADELGDSLEQVRQKAVTAQASLQSASTALRSLRGNSIEVKTAQQELRASQDRNRASLAAANIEILKQGTTLESLNKRAGQASKAIKETAKAELDAAAAAGKAGQEDGLNTGLLRLFGVSRETRSALTELQEGLSVTEVAEAGLVAGSLAAAAAVAVLGAAVVAETISFSKWVLVTQDANRNIALSRQWIAGSAEDSGRMGDQIDRLRQKVPLTVQELTKLYATTRSSLDGARVSGQSILDVVTAVGNASGAGADKAASKIQEIADRNKNFGRFQLNVGQGPGSNAKGELAGTGLDTNDVAKHLAENTKVSLATARAELQRGSVSYVEGIRALKQTSEQAFGEINAKKLISIDAITNRFHDDMAALPKGVNLEPLLGSFDRLEKLFSQSTASGQGLKQVVTAIGTVLGDVATGTTPLLETGIKIAILELLRATTAGVRFSTYLKRGFNEIVTATGSVQAAISLLGDTIEIAFAPITIAVKSIGALKSLLSSTEGHVGFGAKDATPVSTSTFGDSLSGGGRSTASSQVSTGGGSTLVAPANAEGGTVARPAPGEFFASVAPGEQIVPRGGAPSSSSGGPVSVTLAPTFHLGAGGGQDPKKLQQSIESSGLLEKWTKELEDFAKSLGVPTAQAVP